MRTPILALFVTLGALSWSAQAGAQIPERTQQLIVVRTADWTAIPATLERFERNAPDQPWRSLGVVPAVVGKKGMGWGRGLVMPPEGGNADFRQEGDKRAPAGMFALGTAFGLMEAAQAAKTLKWPYLHLSDSIRCIGDNTSQAYNSLVDVRTVQRDWQRDQANEYMRMDAIRDEGAYRWGVFVNHNVDSNPPGLQRDRKSGSCIFLHLWKGPGIGTSGCTAMSQPHMLAILRWLDPVKQPVLVQLPESEYQQLKTPWLLP